MRLSSLLGTGLLLATLSATGVLAQNTRPEIALSTSPYGTLSCGKFMGLGPGERDAIVKKMIATAPASSLSLMNAQSGVAASGEVVQQQNTVIEPPLDSGRLVAACQAATAVATLRDAYSQSVVPPQLLYPSQN